MNHVNYFKDLFESIPVYRKIVLLIYLFKNDNKHLQECGFLKSDIDSLKKEFKNILIEHNEEYYSYVTNQEEFVMERILNK